MIESQRMTFDLDATGRYSTAYSPTFIEDRGGYPGVVEVLRNPQAGKASADDGDRWLGHGESFGK